MPDYQDYLHVVAAVIEDGAGHVLIARRPDHLHQGGLWEFPGGKVEAGEGVEAALSRELQEELGITPVAAEPLIRIPHDYGDRKVLLDVWRVGTFSGEPHGAEGQPIRWVEHNQLQSYDFPAANRPIVSAAILPDRYLITPEPGLRTSWPSFLQRLEQCLQQGIRLVQLRASLLEAAERGELAAQVLPLCRAEGALLMLNAEPEILQMCDADGIHLNSRRLMAMTERPIPQEKWLAASCHDLTQLCHAEKIGVDFAVLSPVQPTSSHPGAAVLGWGSFHALSERSHIPLFALGGMSETDRDVAKRHGGQGIAAIRALWGGD